MTWTGERHLELILDDFRAGTDDWNVRCGDRRRVSSSTNTVHEQCRDLVLWTHTSPLPQTPPCLRHIPSWTGPRGGRSSCPVSGMYHPNSTKVRVESSRSLSVKVGASNLDRGVTVTLPFASCVGVVRGGVGPHCGDTYTDQESWCSPTQTSLDPVGDSVCPT